MSIVSLVKDYKLFLKKRRQFNELFFEINDALLPEYYSRCPTQSIKEATKDLLKEIKSSDKLELLRERKFLLKEISILRCDKESLERSVERDGNTMVKLALKADKSFKEKQELKEENYRLEGVIASNLYINKQEENE